MAAPRDAPSGATRRVSIAALLMTCLLATAAAAPATTAFLDVTTPYAGQAVTAGDSVAITWAAQGINSALEVQLMRLSTLEAVIATGVQVDAGEYQWDVPADSIVSHRYSIALVASDPNTTAYSSQFTIRAASTGGDGGGSGYGPYLGLGFAGLVIIGLAVVCFFHRRKTRKLRKRRTRLELAHTRQQEHLLHEYERRYKLLLPRSTLPYTGGTMVCGGNKWRYVAPPANQEDGAATLVCVSGPFRSAAFTWKGSNASGTVELRAIGPALDDIGYCDWDGDVLRWHSPVRVRRRGAGFVWRYETSDDMAHFMLHGIRRGVSFADEIVPEGEAPHRIFPRLFAVEISSNGSVLAPKRRTNEFSPVGIEGSVPPMLALCVALMEACVSESELQRSLYETQAEGERKEEMSRKRQRALRMFGRIAVVSRFADAKIQVVDSDNADIRVQIVKPPTPADGPGKWQIVRVGASPDYCVQIVKRNADFTVKYVRHSPGVNIPEVADDEV